MLDANTKLKVNFCIKRLIPCTYQELWLFVFKPTTRNRYMGKSMHSWHATTLFYLHSICNMNWQIPTYTTGRPRRVPERFPASICWPCSTPWVWGYIYAGRIPAPAKRFACSFPGGLQWARSCRGLADMPTSICGVTRTPDCYFPSVSSEADGEIFLAVDCHHSLGQ